MREGENISLPQGAAREYGALSRLGVTTVGTRCVGRGNLRQCPLPGVANSGCGALPFARPLATGSFPAATLAAFLPLASASFVVANLAAWLSLPIASLAAFLPVPAASLSVARVAASLPCAAPSLAAFLPAAAVSLPAASVAGSRLLAGAGPVALSLAPLRGRTHPLLIRPATATTPGFRWLDCRLHRRGAGPQPLFARGPGRRRKPRRSPSGPLPRQPRLERSAG